MSEELSAAPHRALTGFRFFPLYRDAFRTLALRQTPDQVARLNGWRLHSDGIHLNGRGGMILVDLVQAFIDGLMPAEQRG
jgi:hypothetical protein